MAEFRSIHCKTWRDDWFSELPTDAKLLWLYLITNQSTSVSGIYQLPVKFIAFETGLDKSRVSQILDMFKSDGKIDYEDSVIWVKKMREYQSSISPKLAKRIQTDFDTIPNGRIKGIYAEKYCMDTVSVPYFPNASDTTRHDPDTVQDTDTGTDTTIPPAKPDGLDDLQHMVLAYFGAKRFKNTTQAALVSAWDRYPQKNVIAACEWAATKGFGLGQAIASIEAALPKWNAPKANGNGKVKRPEIPSVSQDVLSKQKAELERQASIPGTAAYRLAHRHDDEIPQGE